MSSMQFLHRLIQNRFAMMLVIIAMLGTAFGLFGPQTLLWWSLEREAASWVPSPQDFFRPDDSYISPRVDVRGNWAPIMGVHYSISRRDDNTYHIEVSTGCCMGSCRLNRTATYKDGMLKTNKPIAECSGKKYDTIYTVRVDGNDFLVPAANVGRFNELIGEYDPTDKYPPFGALGRFDNTEEL